MVAKLSELLFVKALRRHVDELPPDAKGWLAGLRDSHVGAALRALHAAPAEEWTLAKLACAAGLSRSRLADCFHALIGATPMRYLALLRMQLAARQIEQGAMIADVAYAVGYWSEAAFQRAFKASLGVAPGAWRRQSAHQPASRTG